MTPYPRSLAIGLLRLPGDLAPAERTEARICLALTAVNKGYALIETYEVDGSAAREDSALQAILELAQRIDADALVYGGAVDLERMHEVADVARLMVVEGKMR